MSKQPIELGLFSTSKTGLTIVTNKQQNRSVAASLKFCTQPNKHVNASGKITQKYNKQKQNKNCRR